LWGLWKAKSFSGDGHISPDKLPVLAKAIYERCDDIDGVSDGVINRPLTCDFDPAVHLQQCDAIATNPECFSAAQIAALTSVYGGVRNSSGEVLFPGQPLGAEAEGDMPPWMRTNGPESAWNDWLLMPEGETPRYLNFAVSFLRYSAFEVDDPNYNWEDFDFDTDPALLKKAANIMDADNPDLRPFRESGGKMIHYHHWADTAVPATNSINYFEEVQSVTGDTRDFYKFYLVPGGFHGSQGVGATNVAWLDTIVDWVENGVAPNELLATRKANGETVFSRRLCPYPLAGTYKGTGDDTLAASYLCAK
jgi:feruloyl esterase